MLRPSSIVAVCLHLVAIAPILVASHADVDAALHVECGGNSTEAAEELILLNRLVSVASVRVKQTNEQFESKVLLPRSKLAEAALGGNETLARAACSQHPPKIVLQDLVSILNGSWLFNESQKFFFSSASIKELRGLADATSKQLVVLHGFCSCFSMEDNDDDVIREVISKATNLLGDQVRKIKASYFPEGVVPVVEQFLDQKPPETYAFFSKEIKAYNEKVASELVSLLTQYFSGMNYFAVGVNRADYVLVGKLPPSSVVQVHRNGWTVFVYRSEIDDDFIQVTTNIDQHLDGQSDLTNGSQLCVLHAANETLQNIYAAVAAVCEGVPMCALWPFANVGAASTNRNLGYEHHSFCHTTDFQGFVIYFGLTPVDESDSAKAGATDSVPWQSLGRLERLSSLANDSVAPPEGTNGSKPVNMVVQAIEKHAEEQEEEPSLWTKVTRTLKHIFTFQWQKL